MLDHQLQPPLAHVLVALQAVDQPSRATGKGHRPGIAVGKIERDRIELSASLRRAQSQLEVAFADQARGLDAEYAVEQRLGKPGTPGSRGAARRRQQAR